MLTIVSWQPSCVCKPTLEPGDHCLSGGNLAYIKNLVNHFGCAGQVMDALWKKFNQFPHVPDNGDHNQTEVALASALLQ
jgi:hypothetical protein